MTETRKITLSVIGLTIVAALYAGYQHHLANGPYDHSVRIEERHDGFTVSYSMPNINRETCEEVTAQAIKKGALVDSSCRNTEN